jgi:arginase
VQGGEALDEVADQLALDEDGVRAGVRHGAVERPGRVAGERDQAERRMVVAEPGDRGDTVEARHVQVDHDRVRLELVDELDCGEPVTGGTDDSQLGLAVDQVPQRGDEALVVVGEQDADRAAGPLGAIHARTLALPRVASQDQRAVAVIGAPLDLGQDRRGVDMGPSAIRYAGLSAELARLGLETHDLGNVVAPVAESTDVGSSRARFLQEILGVCDGVAGLVAEAVAGGETPLVLGGDHSVALGTLVGLSRAHGSAGGVLWIDAHGDLNTPESSPSGNVHGMVLAAAMGHGGDAFEFDDWRLPAVEPSRVALVGVRSLDAPERELLHRLDARVFTMSDLDRIGVQEAMGAALEHLDGAPFVHVSFDMDVVDPAYAPGVGTPVRGGLSYREAHLAMELVAEAGVAGSFEVVEVNPILDRENETARLAVELVASALGARIL